MNAKFSFLSLLLIVLFSTQISLANEPAAMLARKAVSTEAAEATAAIEELRAMGPAGLEALLGEKVKPPPPETPAFEETQKNAQHLSLREQFELHPELWVEAGDDVVVTGRVVARTRTGRKLDAPYAHVFSFRDGKVCRNDNFHDTALWVAALS